MAKFCNNCGSATEPGTKFCNECGTKLDQTPIAPIQNTLSQQQPYSQPESEQVSPEPPPPLGGSKGSQKTMALYDQDYDQPSTPTPGAQVPPAFAPKPRAVYPQQQVLTPNPPPAHIHSSPSTAIRDKADNVLVTALFLLIMSIPFFGLIPAVNLSIKPEKGTLSINAKAMIIVNVISTVVCLIVIYYFYSILSQVATVNIEWFW